MVDTEKMFESGEVIKSAIFTTIRVAVLLNARHLINTAGKTEGIASDACVHAAERYIELALTTQTTSRRDWTYNDWTLIQTCLINMSEEEDRHDYKAHALDYTEKKLQRMD